VFYIAHLSDEERMFFVSLLYSAVETWMRSQSGSTSLRALIYFDEIFGYLPPIGNPPSKEPMLRMLKQARAFGVGLVLATQNPVDVDYKGLSNAGTWFIGKLQTDQDKQRLLDGLTGAAGGLNRGQYDDLLSSLGKRVFLLHNVHEKQPVLFQTRWAMNYLAGPLTRTQIPALNAMAKAEIQSETAETAPGGLRPGAATAKEEEATPAAAEVSPVTDMGSKTKPAVPGRVMEYFLPNNLSLSQSAKASGKRLSGDARSLGLLYQPVLLAQADIIFLNRKYNLNHVEQRTTLVHEPNRRGMVRWDSHLTEPISLRALDRRPAPEAIFASLEQPLSDAKLVRSMEKDFLDWAYQTVTVNVKANEALDVYAGPEVSDEAFQEMCAEAAEAEREEEVEKVEEAFDKKIDRVMDKLKREERELREDEAEYAQRKQEEGLSHVETVLSLFSRRKKSLSTSLTKRRMTAKAKADVEESIEAIEELESEIEALKEEEEEELEELAAEWEEAAENVTEIPVKPYKKDINLTIFGLAWFPYHIVDEAGKTTTMPGFEFKKS
jgi:hypothetical protein